MRITKVILAAIFLSGCVAPVKHIYYEPSKTRGELVRSSSCGFLKNNKNTLLRSYNNFTVRVSVPYREDIFIVHITFEADEKLPDVVAQGIKATDLTRGVVLTPSETKNETRTVRTMRNGRVENVIRKSITHSYPFSSKDIEKVSIGFASKSVMSDMGDIFIEEVVFTRKESMDLYYASINC
jgi:hypothetical protein